jgi:cell division protein FtsQ
MRAGEGAHRAGAHRGWALAGLGLIVLAGAAVAATYTPLFAARDIDLRGAGELQREMVLDVARVDEDTNVFHLDVSATERRLEADPMILDATVSTTLPDGIEIAVVLRTPVGIVGTPGELVGADGIVIGPATGDADLPSLESLGGRPVDGDALVTAARAADALGVPLRRSVDAIVVTGEGELAIRVADGFTATFGPPIELEAKAGSLAALLAWIEDEGVTVTSADLTVPGSPTATLEQSHQAVPVP